MPRILIIEDDLDLSERLRRSLEQQGFTTDVANDGDTGLLMLKQYKYDAAILDWNMPGATGPEIAARFRKDGGTVPLIMLTGESEIKHKEIGFGAGVDDYVTKPFNVKELTLRLNALLRRAPKYRENVLVLGDLKVDVDSSTVHLAGEELTLQRLEFRLLEFFARHPGHTYSAEALLEHVWPADSDASIETVRSYIKTLRKKMAAHAESPTIRNIYGLGYKLDLDS